MEIPNELRAHMPDDAAEKLAACDPALIAMVGFAPDGEHLIPNAWFAPELDEETGALLLNKLAFKFSNPDLENPDALITVSIASVPGLTDDSNACIKLSGDVERLGAVGIIAALMQLVTITAKNAGIPLHIDHQFTNRNQDDGSGAYL